MRFNEGHRPAQGRVRLPRFGPEFPFVRVGQPRRNQFQEIEQIVLPRGFEHAIPIEKGTKQGRSDPSTGQGNTRLVPLRRRGSAVVDLPALQEGDDLSFANDRNNKLAQSSVTAVAERLSSTACREKLRLIAHGAQLRAPRKALQSAAERLGSSFLLKENQAATVH